MRSSLIQGCTINFRPGKTRDSSCTGTTLIKNASPQKGFVGEVQMRELDNAKMLKNVRKLV